MAIASILPCYDIYRLLGQKFKESPQLDNPYRKWIETYSDPEFIKSTEKMIEIMNRLAGLQDENTHPQMIEAYTISTKHELSFLDEIYHPEKGLKVPTMGLVAF